MPAEVVMAKSLLRRFIVCSTLCLSSAPAFAGVCDNWYWPANPTPKFDPTPDANPSRDWVSDSKRLTDCYIESLLKLRRELQNANLYSGNLSWAVENLGSQLKHD